MKKYLKKAYGLSKRITSSLSFSFVLSKGNDLRNIEAYSQGIFAIFFFLDVFFLYFFCLFSFSFFVSVLFLDLLLTSLLVFWFT